MPIERQRISRTLLPGGVAEVHLAARAGLAPPRRHDAPHSGPGGSGRRSQDVSHRYRLGITLFLAAALGSFALSIGLWFTEHREEGVFVGLWVPSILAAGAFWTTAVRAR